MKPAPFDYERATSLDAALDALSRIGDEAKVLAGGQSLVPMLALRMARPSTLLDVNGVEELARIEHNGHLEIGAVVRQRTAERSSAVREAVPLIAEAIECVGHPQIRNRGTVGGSLAHADPAAELPSVMVALGAELVAQRAGGMHRIVPAAEFFKGFFTTSLEADELLTSVRVPVLPAGSGCAWREFSRRHGDFALVGVAVVLTFAQATGAIETARVVLSGVGPAPVRAAVTEAMLIGQLPSVDLWTAAAAEAAREIDPTADVQGSAPFRRRVAGAVVAEALAAAATSVGARSAGGGADGSAGSSGTRGGAAS